jgi:hypothetical protein
MKINGEVLTPHACLVRPHYQLIVSESGNGAHEACLAYHIRLRNCLQAQAVPLVDILKVVPQRYVPSLLGASWALDEYSEANLVKSYIHMSSETDLIVTYGLLVWTDSRSLAQRRMASE